MFFRGVRAEHAKLFHYLPDLLQCRIDFLKNQKTLFLGISTFLHLSGYRIK